MRARSPGSVSGLVSSADSGKTMRSYGPWSRASEREVLLGEGLVGLLGEGQLFVVALQHRHPEMPGGARLEARDVDQRRRREQPDDAHGREHRGARRAGAQREREVEHQSVHRHDDEAHEQRAAHTRQGAGGGAVVERDADIDPREPPERPPPPQGLQHDPGGGGEERRGRDRDGRTQPPVRRRPRSPLPSR